MSVWERYLECSMSAKQIADKIIAGSTMPDGTVCEVALCYIRADARPPRTHPGRKTWIEVERLVRAAVEESRLKIPHVKRL